MTKSSNAHSSNDECIENDTFTQTQQNTASLVIEAEKTSEAQSTPQTPEEHAVPEVETGSDQSQEKSKEELLDEITQYISRAYVRRDKRYYRASDTAESYSLDDLKHVLATTLPELYPSKHLDAELIQGAMKKAMVEKHSDVKRKVPIWSGKSECKPGQFGSFVFDEGFATINTWICPAYRLLEGVKPSTKLLDALLARTMAHEQDRELFKNWLAWNLQNEAEKPAWAVILYSQNKGTGKSTLLEFMTKLAARATA